MLADEKPLGLQSWGGGEGSSPQKLPMGKPLSCLLRSLRPCGRRSGVTLQCLTEEGVLVSLLPRALGRAGDRPSLPCLPPPRSGERGSGQPGAPGSRSAGPPPGAGARKVGQRGSRAPGGFRSPRAERACPAPSRPALPPSCSHHWAAGDPAGQGGYKGAGKGARFPLFQPLGVVHPPREARPPLPAAPARPPERPYYGPASPWATAAGRSLPPGPRSPAGRRLHFTAAAWLVGAGPAGRPGRTGGAASTWGGGAGALRGSRDCAPGGGSGRWQSTASPDPVETGRWEAPALAPWGPNPHALPPPA